MPATSRRLKLGVLSFICGFLCTAHAQDLHMRVTGQTYTDRKISVTAPPNWTIAADDGVDSRGGAILRQGKYVLRLCTGCGQVSGIVGGRFAEISGLVQPWFRSDPGANPSFCGKEESIRISANFKRTDLWFRRDPAHVYDEDADDCRQPRTTATVWYGSYFEENCSPAAQFCGGYFLDVNWLTRRHLGEVDPSDQMAFGMTYDQTDLDQLPRKTDPELKRVLDEAASIVRSIHYQPQKPPKTSASP